MDVEAALKQILDDDADVSAIVANRIHVPMLPQKVQYPAVAFRTMKETDDYTLDGDFTSTVMVRVFSTAIGVSNYALAKSLDRAIRSVLRGFLGTVSDDASPESIIEIQGIFRVQCTYSYVNETETHEWVSDYKVLATEP